MTTADTLAAVRESNLPAWSHPAKLGRAADGGRHEHGRRAERERHMRRVYQFSPGKIIIADDRQLPSEFFITPDTCERAHRIDELKSEKSGE